LFIFFSCVQEGPAVIHALFVFFGGVHESLRLVSPIIFWFFTGRSFFSCVQGIPAPETQSIASLLFRTNIQYVKELIISYLQLFFRRKQDVVPVYLLWIVMNLLCIYCDFVMICLWFRRFYCEYSHVLQAARACKKP
jgi:hypothetical protein